jgi:hypothetical protein
VLVMAGTLPALASGFSVYEQSAKASGQAGDWVARAADAAARGYNPGVSATPEGVIDGKYESFAYLLGAKITWCL